MLEQLKELEKKQREALLLKSLKELKSLCKEVLSSKERVNILLEELGITGKDQKGIIDWINSLPDVQLDEQDKRNLKKKTKEKIKKEKEEISDYDFSPITTTGLSASSVYVGDAVTDNITRTCSSGPMSGVTLAYNGETQASL